jgi:four helix bundle protein
LCDRAGVAGVSRHEDLDVWRLCVELRDRIFVLTQTGRPTRNQRFIEQIRDSSSSAPRNVAEGFSRFRPKEFAYFVRIARGSLGETMNHIQDAATKNYLTEAQSAELMVLVKRCLGATTKFLAYLESCTDPDEPHRRKRSKRRRKNPEPEP